MKLLKYLGYFVSWSLRLFLIVAAFYYLFQGDLTGALLLILSFGFALLPLILRWVYNVKLHWIYDVIFSVLIAGHMIGFVGAYYYSIVYDDFIHVIGSFFVGLVGFSLAYAYDNAKKIRITVPIIAWFTIIWTIAIGSIWEILEFLWDNIILLSAEYGFAQDSLLDTMIDLSWDLLAGIIAALVMVKFSRKAKPETKKEVFGPIVNLITRKKPEEF